MAAPAEKKARVDPTASPFKVFYLGEEGSLTHNAATRFFANSPKAELQGVESLADAFKGIKDGKILYAVLPIENSASGSLSQTYDALGENDVKIGGELSIRENYALCVKEGVDLASVKRVLSHPNIIEACSSFIEEKLPGVETVLGNDTACAARQVGSCTDKASAAIATREAAKLNNLTILATDIGDYKQNKTRYILIHRSTGPVTEVPAPFPRDAVGPIRKNSAAFVMLDEPNALVKILTCFAHRNINVLKMETRPLKGHNASQDRPGGNLWDMVIFVEFCVPPGQTAEANEKLWANLSECSVWRRDYGIYPSTMSRNIKMEERDVGDMVDAWTK